MTIAVADVRTTLNTIAEIADVRAFAGKTPAALAKPLAEVARFCVANGLSLDDMLDIRTTAEEPTAEPKPKRRGWLHKPRPVSPADPPASLGDSDDDLPAVLTRPAVLRKARAAIPPPHAQGRTEDARLARQGADSADAARRCRARPPADRRRRRAVEGRDDGEHRPQGNPPRRAAQPNRAGHPRGSGSPAGGLVNGGLK